MKYAVYTLGCKVNQYETQAIEAMLRERGFEPVDAGADVVVVNTCAVTAESGRSPARPSGGSRAKIQGP